MRCSQVAAQRRCQVEKFLEWEPGWLHSWGRSPEPEGRRRRVLRAESQGAATSTAAVTDDCASRKFANARHSVGPTAVHSRSVVVRAATEAQPEGLETQSHCFLVFGDGTKCLVDFAGEQSERWAGSGIALSICSRSEDFSLRRLRSSTLSLCSSGHSISLGLSVSSCRFSVGTFIVVL